MMKWRHKANRQEKKADRKDWQLLMKLRQHALLKKTKLGNNKHALNGWRTINYFIVYDHHEGEIWSFLIVKKDTRSFMKYGYVYDKLLVILNFTLEKSNPA